MGRENLHNGQSFEWCTRPGVRMGYLVCHGLGKERTGRSTQGHTEYSRQKWGLGSISSNKFLTSVSPCDIKGKLCKKLFCYEN